MNKGDSWIQDPDCEEAEASLVQDRSFVRALAAGP